MPVGIPNGSRPGAVKCKVYREGTARASAGFLQGLSGVPTKVYICQDGSLVARLTQSPGVPGSSSSAYSAVVAYDRFAPHEKRTKIQNMSKLSIYKRSITHL